MQPAVQAMLVALVRAHRDPRRQKLREEGMDERDLAFEADMLIPADMEISKYATVKRGRIVRLLRSMKEEGLIEFKNPGSKGLYRISPTPLGEQEAEKAMRSWFRKLLDRFFRSRATS